MKLGFFNSVLSAERVRKLLKTDLVRATAFSAMATVVKLITALVINKIISVYLGPAGVAIIGQMTNFIIVAYVLGGSGINSGVVKYISEYKTHEPEKIPSLLSSGLWIVIISSVIVALVTIIGADYFARTLLFNDNLKSVFYVLGATVILYSFNSVVLSVLNGYKLFRKFYILNMLSSICGLVISFILIYNNRLTGALYATTLNQAIPFFISLILIAKEPWFKKQYWTQKIDNTEAKKLLKYVVMAVIATSAMPLAQLFLRSEVIKATSKAEAGLWDTVNRISNIYLLFIITALSTYYLPRLSEIKDNMLLRLEIIKTYKIMMPLVIIAASAVYFMRHIIIKILFTDAFTGAADLFLFQAIGDVMKIATWLLSVQLIAKAMARVYITMEILFTLSFALLSIISFRMFGLVGLTYAYALNYTLNFSGMVWVFRKQLFPGNR